MKKVIPTPLPLAVRVYPLPDGYERPPWRGGKTERPDGLLVLDTETTIDPTQRLKFGCYRFYYRDRCQMEGLFMAEDLPVGERLILEQYVRTHPAGTARGNSRRLRLLSLEEFRQVLYELAYEGRCLIVGFNLPFDLSRIAHDAGAARGRFTGGFSFGLWPYTDDAGSRKSDPYRPRLRIKPVNSKRALMGFAAPLESGWSAKREESERHSKFQGNFLDLKTLAAALMERGFSLAGACDVFGVEHPKQKVSQHGVVTEEYINYCRRDVLATYELALKLFEARGTPLSCR